MGGELVLLWLIGYFPFFFLMSKQTLETIVAYFVRVYNADMTFYVISMNVLRVVVEFPIYFWGTLLAWYIDVGISLYKYGKLPATIDKCNPFSAPIHWAHEYNYLWRTECDMGGEGVYFNAHRIGVVILPLFVLFALFIAVVVSNENAAEEKKKEKKE